MYKAFKFRLYPNEEQRTIINKNFGCNRFVYNYYLDKIKTSKFTNAYDYIKDYTSKLKMEYPFLQEADSTLIRKSIFHLEDNMKRYFNNGFGYPKFKSKYDKNSYTTSAIYGSYKDNNYCNIEIDLKKREIKLPKLKWVKIRGYRNLRTINGRIINTTISRDKTNKYYVSVMCEILVKSKVENPQYTVGIDVGIKNLITLSDCTFIENNHYIKKFEKRIKRIQRALSRKEKKSNNYYKCKQKLARLYNKLINARKYYIHKITKDITDNYDIITCENLKTQSMIENTKTKSLIKNITDATFAEIIKELEYKSKEKGKYFYKVNEYYPSSQICSMCGMQDKKYKNIKERTYECKCCHNEIDRDLNASININFEGIKRYMKEVLTN